MIFRARWVLPIERPPVENGWVRIEHGVIEDVGSGAPRTAGVTDLGDVVLLPGLINAHTHLELSWMDGRIPAAPSMASWIAALMKLRRECSPPDEAQKAAAAAALRRARARGTIAVGDISNTLVTADVLASTATPSVLFHEVLGFMPHDADGRAADAAERVESVSREPVAPGLAPHAPYSVSPDLFRAVERETSARGLLSSVHLGESPEEVEFLMTGSGPIADTLQALGVWNDRWVAPRMGPVEYLDGMGVLKPGLLVVHATQLDSGALARVKERGCVLVSCPRSNRRVGAGDPPLDSFYRSGAVVALGTDSLASAPDLDMFGELSAARAASTVSPATLLHSATAGGASALGLQRRFGRIAPGLRGPLLAAAVPAGIADVQEYLVSGAVEDLQWVG